MSWIIVFNCLQQVAMFKAQPILEESIKELLIYHGGNTAVPADCLKVEDLGYSSGPNTLLLVSDIMDMVRSTCQQLKREEPMLQVFLNDLPANDFNTVFRWWPSFYEKFKNEKGGNFGPRFLVGLPGIFYGRLFPNNFLHFVHSFYCRHWRSQVSNNVLKFAIYYYMLLLYMSYLYMLL